MHEFFVVCAPGFEKTAKKEIEYWWPLIQSHFSCVDDLELTLVKGGIEVRGPRDFVLMNHLLKTASRILLRFYRFQASDPRQLHLALKELPCLDFIPKGGLRFSLTTTQTKLNHKKKLEQTLRQSLPAVQAQVFVRISGDDIQISLDTSGEHLHKRGRKRLMAQAPLRENLAAAVLLSALSQSLIPPVRPLIIYDPMMGSGTILIEAEGLYQPVTERGFDFQQWLGWPQWPSASWSHFETHRDWRFYGSDRDSGAVSTAVNNWPSGVGDLHCETIDLLELDQHFFSKRLLQERERIGAFLWVVTNPPYGERVRAGTLDKLNAIAQFIDPDLMSFVVPEKFSKLQFAGYQKWQELRFSNGGIPVKAIHFLKRQLI